MKVHTTKQKKCKYIDFSKRLFFSQRKIFKFYFFSLDSFFMFSEFIKIIIIFKIVRVSFDCKNFTIYYTHSGYLPESIHGCGWTLPIVRTCILYPIVYIIYLFTQHLPSMMAFTHTQKNTIICISFFSIIYDLLCLFASLIRI